MNGRPGDNPLADVLHGRPVFSPAVDALVREVAALSDTTRSEWLGRRVLRCRPSSADDVAALERELANLRDELRAEAVARGWEVAP